MNAGKAAGFVLAWALVLAVAGPATPAWADQTSPQQFFAFLAQRVDAVNSALANNRLTVADAVAELDDLLVIVQAGEFAFRSDFAALGASGSTLSGALVSAEELIATARAALAASASALAAQRLTTAKGALEVVAAGFAAGGVSGLTPTQQQFLASLSVGTAATVSGASFTAPVAPGSIASVFGDRLAASAASAQFDSQGRLPLMLGGTSLIVGGQPAALLSVGPGQANLVLPSELSPGSQEVVVSTDTGRIVRGTVNVATVAPGIFTFSMNGTGEGDIVNGVTGARGPFAVTTPSTSGDDKRTRLSIYLTGIRNAPGLPGSVRVTIGGQSVGVEFAGPQPNFVGLDQINVLVPPALANAGILNLQVKIGDAVSNVVQVAFAESGALIFRFAPASAAAEAALPFSQAMAIAGPRRDQLSLEAEGLPSGAEFALFAGNDLASAIAATAPIGLFRAESSGRVHARIGGPAPPLGAGPGPATALSMRSVLLLRAVGDSLDSILPGRTGFYGPVVLTTTGDLQAGATRE